ncbi:MAG: hypothetical protein WCF90_10330 [Methanomicrobiales archaeon]
MEWETSDAVQVELTVQMNANVGSRTVAQSWCSLTEQRPCLELLGGEWGAFIMCTLMLRHPAEGLKDRSLRSDQHKARHQGNGVALQRGAPSAATLA